MDFVRTDGQMDFMGIDAMFFYTRGRFGPSFRWSPDGDLDSGYYNKFSIDTMYIPEYVMRRSGEMLYKMIAREFNNVDGHRIWHNNNNIFRDKWGYPAFIIYDVDSTWYRRIVSLINSEQAEFESGDDVIMDLWHGGQLNVLDQELAVTILKLESEMWHSKIHQYEFDRVVRLILRFNLDMDRCLETVYGIDSSHLHAVNYYLMMKRQLIWSKFDSSRVEFNEQIYKLCWTNRRIGSGMC